MTDSDRLDFLERQAMDHPLVLHNEEQRHWGDFRGFALGPNKTLRQMIDWYVRHEQEKAARDSHPLPTFHVKPL